MGFERIVPDANPVAETATRTVPRARRRSTPRGYQPDDRLRDLGGLTRLAVLPRRSPATLRRAARPLPGRLLRSRIADLAGRRRPAGDDVSLGLVDGLVPSRTVSRRGTAFRSVGSAEAGPRVESAAGIVEPRASGVADAARLIRAGWVARSLTHG